MLLTISRARSFSAVSITLVLAAASGACVESDTETTVSAWSGREHSGIDGRVADGVSPRLLRRFQPMDVELTENGSPPDAKLVSLGQRLFEDPILSGDRTVSCKSCHDLDKWGADGRATSIGVGGRTGSRNAPTVLNAAASFRQFWDGRAGTVEEQALGPILNPNEMDLPSAKEAIARLEREPSYVVSFAAAFPHERDPITFEHLGAAIGAFERTLVTPTRWDTYLAGDRSALTSEEKRGLKTFLDVGCMVCHTGQLVGGSMFARAGIVEPWPNQVDQGRYVVTGQEGDRMVFKVPGLRNVSKTAPYFHDGSVPDLPEAVRMMGRHQLGIELTEKEVGSIVSWLGSLANEGPPSVDAAPRHIDSETRAPARRSPVTSGVRSATLRSLMIGTARPALAAGDRDKLVRAFEKIAALAPSGLDRWAEIASTGAVAAQRGDIEAAGAACDGCHSLYR